MKEIYAVGGKLDLVITLHDHLARKKSGRVYLDDFCAGHDIPLLKIRHIDDPEAVQAVRNHGIDWLFIIGWSQIAGPQVLTAPKEGCIGIHPTLLPEGRGRAAIPWSIIKGLDKTGVTMFKLAEGVDNGPILGQVEIPLAADETSATLYPRVGDAHRTLMRKVWPSLEAGTLEQVEQDESKATYWEGRTPDDGVILSSMSCTEVDRLVRATTRPYPGAFFETDSARFRIWAGKAHKGVRQTCDYDSCRDRIWIPLADGSFEATEWNREAPAVE